MEVNAKQLVRMWQLNLRDNVLIWQLVVVWLFMTLFVVWMERLILILVKLDVIRLV